MVKFCLAIVLEVAFCCLIPLVVVEGASKRVRQKYFEIERHCKYNAAFFVRVPSQKLLNKFQGSRSIRCNEKCTFVRVSDQRSCLTHFNRGHASKMLVRIDKKDKTDT